ncbi:hypothetical protein RU30_13145 [Salmonella enterica subsp. enterica serovar Give]|nr:hypothetical protein [Salmonella enterica subsp. enterica serovar Give]
MKRDVLKKCFTPDPNFSLILIIMAAIVSFLFLRIVSIIFPDFSGWKRDVLNGILVWAIDEGARRIQKICKRFKL